MNTQTYEHPKTTKGTLRKKLFILSMLVAGLFAANSAFSQVRVEAHVGIGAPPPPVVVYERDYPGYTYYTYPAWHGHYRDRFYYTHYRPYFEREHRAYFNGRRFDHDRFERENHWREGRGHDRGNHRGHDDRRDDHGHRH
ncbi:MAG TPA: hypothetical protein VL832_11100 [Puia sp.]|nr:hypothetical protein [Puia sp.]